MRRWPDDDAHGRELRPPWPAAEARRWQAVMLGAAALLLGAAWRSGEVWLGWLALAALLSAWAVACSDGEAGDE
jgi:hypothetical protein